MATAFVAGAFGQRNPGDEALLSALLDGLPGWDVVAASSDPRATAAAHSCRAVQARNPAAVGRAVAASDAVVVAGGTVFKLLHPATGRKRSALLRNTLALMVGARALRKPRAMIGVGADAVSGRQERWMARGIVRNTSLTILRDEESARRLAAAGVTPPFRIGADPAWTLLDRPTPNGGGGDGVAVTLSWLAGGRGFDEHLATALRQVAGEGLPIHLQPWQVNGGREDDLALAQSVARRLGRRAEVLPPPASLGEARDQLGRYRVVLGLRFHSLVAAASAGVPFVTLAHEPKLAGLARRMHQTAVPSASEPNLLASAVLRALGGPPPSGAAVQGEIARADEAVRLLRLLLSRGRSPEANEITGLPLWPDRWIP